MTDKKLRLIHVRSVKADLAPQHYSHTNVTDSLLDEMFSDNVVDLLLEQLLSDQVSGDHQQLWCQRAAHSSSHHLE